MTQLVTVKNFEKTGRDGAPADSVRDMLICYGFKQSPTNPKKWVHSNYPNLQCAVNIHNGPVAGAELAQCIGVCSNAEKKGWHPAIPIEPVPAWVDDALPSGYNRAMENGTLKLWKGEYRELPLSFTLTSNSQSAVTGSLKNTKSYEAQLEAHKDSLGALEHDYGVKLQRENGRLHVPESIMGQEYNIRFSNGTAQDDHRLATELGALWEALFLYSDDCVSKASTLEQHGFTLVPCDNQTVTKKYTHPNLRSPLQITPQGEQSRLDSTDIEKIDKAIADSIAPPIEAAKQKLFHHYIPKTQKAVLKDEDKVDLIMDASALNDLANIYREADRGGWTRTWLDLLPVIADLDPVNRIIIPSTIADWECRGSITENGDLKLLDNNYNPGGELHEKAKPLVGLLPTASRYSVDDDGHWTLVKEGNPNLVICETPFDREVAATIRDYCKDRKKGAQINLEPLRAKLKNKGEEAMEALAHDYLGSECPAYMISTDFTWMKAKAAQKEHEDCPTTSHGQALAEASIFTLIEAACASNRSELAQRLKEQFGFPVNAEHIENGFKNGKRRDDTHSNRSAFTPYSSEGCNAYGIPGITLEELLSKRTKVSTVPPPKINYSSGEGRGKSSDERDGRRSAIGGR